MKIAYFTPLNPIRSGISDFAEELLPDLVTMVQIDLFVDNIIPDSQQIRDNFLIYDIEEYCKNEKLRSSYDFAIFQVGNHYEYHKKIVATFQQFGGILELHDFTLHDFVAGLTLGQNKRDEYIKLLGHCHGQTIVEAAEDFFAGKTEALWLNRALELPVNKYLIDRATAVIVHSDFAKQMVISINPFIPVISIPLPAKDIITDPEDFKRTCKLALRINEEIKIFGSFGLGTANKRILQTLEAIALYQDATNHSFRYIIVGEVIDQSILAKITELHLQDKVIITGFVDIDYFKLYMGACDVCINLRFPTQGETSAILSRTLGMGKPTLVSNVGSYADYPDNVVYKINPDKDEVINICQALLDITSDAELGAKLSGAALAYGAKNLAVEEVVNRYSTFLCQLSTEDFCPSINDILVSQTKENMEYFSEDFKSLAERMQDFDSDAYLTEISQKTSCVVPNMSILLVTPLMEFNLNSDEYIHHLADIMNRKNR